MELEHTGKAGGGAGAVGRCQNTSLSFSGVGSSHGRLQGAQRRGTTKELFLSWRKDDKLCLKLGAGPGTPGEVPLIPRSPHSSRELRSHCHLRASGSLIGKWRSAAL